MVRKTLPKNNRVESPKFYVEQERIRKHLDGLSVEGLAELEIDAINSSPSFLTKSFQRAVASGSETLVREYRRCLLERHLRMVFCSRDDSISTKNAS